jgi:hypothetical protein
MTNSGPQLRTSSCHIAGRRARIGIYLVFWFGTVKRVSTHPDGLPAPTTAEALRSMLEEQLPTPYAETVKVVVIDVSEPSKPGKSSAREGKRARQGGRRRSPAKGGTGLYDRR